MLDLHTWKPLRVPSENCVCPNPMFINTLCTMYGYLATLCLIQLCDCISISQTYCTVYINWKTKVPTACPPHDMDKLKSEMFFLQWKIYVTWSREWVGCREYWFWVTGLKRWQILMFFIVFKLQRMFVSLQPDVQLRWGLDQNVAF